MEDSEIQGPESGDLMAVDSKNHPLQKPQRMGHA